jgi:hypothetical protein
VTIPPDTTALQVQGWRTGVVHLCSGGSTDLPGRHPLQPRLAAAEAQREASRGGGAGVRARSFRWHQPKRKVPSVA